MRFPIFAKASALAAVLLALVWALSLVSGIVAERSGRLAEAQRSVAESLASSQTIVGPIIQRVCTERREVEKGEGKDKRKVSEERSLVLRSLPDTLSIESDSRTDPRYRGIYRVNAFVLKAKLTATWARADPLVPARERDGSVVTCGPTVIWAGVSDTRGIRSARIVAEGQNRSVVPSGRASMGAQGFEADWSDEAPLAGQPVQVELELELAGTQDLAFVPLGDSTRVTLSSDWPHPSFGGRFLPVSREVGVNGFKASWQVSGLATQAPQQIRASGTLCQSAIAPQGSSCIESFGVSFIDPVSPYTLSDRATKYGLLFIVLTFVAVALVEVMLRRRVHPVQYLLVGAALTVFFLLLISLSEHIGFGRAYVAAGAACTALLAFYGTHVLGNLRRGLTFGGAIATVFGLLYVLLLQEQTALMIGSLTLFLVLAGVMIVTRKIDWYGLIAQVRSATRPSTAP